MSQHLPLLVRQEFERGVGLEGRNRELGACYREGRDDNNTIYQKTLWDYLTKEKKKSY